MGCQHLLFLWQIKQLLRPTKGFIKKLWSDTMVDNVDKPNPLACFGEIFCDSFLFLW